MAPGGAFVCTTSGAPYYWSGYQAAPTALAIPAGATSFTDLVIADNGQIAGIAAIGGVSTPVYWSSPTATPTKLTTLGTGDSLTIAGVNSAGIVVGIDGVFAANNAYTQHAVRWVGGKVQDLNNAYSEWHGLGIEWWRARDQRLGVDRRYWCLQRHREFVS